MNDRRAGPPDLGPGLLFFMKLSSCTTINDGLDMVGLPDLALRHTAELL